MFNYEPELQFAFDSKNKHANLVSVYDVIGNKTLYCPICLGRVRVWNGQNPDKTYQKQRCFHHIDEMCSQESRIHFAYKTWLLEKGSKFNVGKTTYKVFHSEIEKPFHTKFGDYRPDITVETTDKKIFYIEIANTNKKNRDYLSKWHELGNDVLELDVNEQLLNTSIGEIPNFKMIYSSTTGMCFCKQTTDQQDYNEIIYQLNKNWSQHDLTTKKQLLESFNWFWLYTQKYYSNTIGITDICTEYAKIDKVGKQIIYSCLKGSKHSILRKYLLNVLQNDFNTYLENIKEYYNSFGYTTSTYVYKSNYGINISYYEEGYYISCLSKTFSLNKNFDYEEIFDLKQFLPDCDKRKNKFKQYIEKIHLFDNFPFITIRPTYNVPKDSYEIFKLRFNVKYKAHIHNKYILEKIGYDSWELLDCLNVNKYDRILHEAIDERDKEIVTYLLKNNKIFMQYLDDILSMVQKISRLKLKISKDYASISLFDNAELLMEWNFTSDLLFGVFEIEFYNSFIDILTPMINTEKERRKIRRKINKIINKYGEMVNESKLWNFEIDYLSRWKVSVSNYELIFSPQYSIFPRDDKLLDAYIKNLFTKYMNQTLTKFNEWKEYYN